MKNIMKTLTLLIGFTMIISCKKDDSKLCANLLEDGVASQSLLLGEWCFENYAYSKNGKNITIKSEIQNGCINVTDSGKIWFNHTNEILYNYNLINSNEITINQIGSTYVNAPQEEIDVTLAFSNSHCYVIKGNKLFLHYTEIDEKNILILTK